MRGNDNRRLVRNSAHCNVCDTEIVSTHRHDFVRCECGRIAVDGGLAYAKRLFADDANWEDTSLYEDELSAAELALWNERNGDDDAY